MLLCMHCIARGQTGLDYRYWFDNDYSTVRQGHSATGKWQVDAEMDGLSESLHAIHLQVVDSKGVESAPVTRFFLKTRDTSVKQGYYWFDGDRTAQQLLGQVQGVFTIDVAKLAEGFHTFYYQVVGKDGSLSAIVSRSFYKVVIPEAARYRCWVDDDPTTMTTGKYTGAPVLVDISQISEGYHIMRVQIEEVTPSAVVSRPFVKIPQTEGVEYLKCLCVVDDKLYKEENVSSTGGVIGWNFDVSSLPQGFHRMQIQVITPSGAATSTYDAYFLRTTTTEEMADMKCVYAIDGNEFDTEAGSMSNGAFHCDLDVAHLSDGLHRLSYKLSNGKGVETKVQTHFFIKTPVGGNGIAQYRYWLNDQPDSIARTVTLPGRQDPFKLITLLPVESQPLRSSLFEFRVEQEQPVVYAKNDFHVRFYDAAGRFTDAVKQYVDESVREVVADITPIYNGDRKTKAVPEDNGIHWFKFYAEEGDTVTFRTDQAATLQVFNPEGKEVYSAQGSTSVAYGGCHTWTDGTYYVALHDVTGSKPNISLDFTHLAKYDVVSYDIAVVGNGGCSTITFKGNGFRDLYAVDFINAANDSIHAFSIGHESDGTTSVTADFTDASTGKYTALFHFTEGKKYVYDAVTVEDAVPIELATEVTFPRSFGHVVTYTCKITNNGNMTAYAVPVYTWLKSKTLNGITHIEYEGLDLRGFYDEIETDTLSTEEIVALSSESAKLGHDHYFYKLRTEDEDNPGDSVFVRANYFFANIAPYETKILHLTLTMRETDAFAYFTVPEEWPSYGSYEESPAGSRLKMRHASEKSNNWYCCYRERIECAANITMLVLDAATLVNPELGVADCALGWANQRLTAAGDTYCGKNDVEGDFIKRVNALTKTASAASVLAGCAGHAIGSNVINAFLHPSVAINCITAFFQKIPGCPPDPPGGGGAQGGKSHDPNDIYGYLAESGSKFMSDEVEKVNYRIEFENDTAFATRSAMVVEIRDTLDSRLFDLSSYTPTSIKIGEKVEYLDGEPNFVKTIDMRPEINGLVTVEGKYDAQKGIMTWLFTSIDPMTMEPTNDPMDGFLPVNTDGNGIGEVAYDINLKQKMAEGTEIPNRASIVFDINEPILTPTWTNIVDATAPTSRVESTSIEKIDTVTLHLAGEDARSGVWRYTVYVQDGVSAPWREVGVTDTCVYDFAFEKGIDYGFCVLATDSAGNVEQKELVREATLRSFIPGDANGDEVVDTKDAILVIGYYLGQEGVYLNASAADIVEDGVIDTKDAIAIINQYLNTSAGVKQKTNRKRIRVL